MRGSGFIIFFAIIASLSLLLDWYVFSGLKTLSGGWPSRWRHTVTFGYLVISIGVTITFFLGLGSLRRAQGMMPYHEWVLSIFLAFLISKLLFVIVLFLGDLGRFFYGIADHFIKPKTHTTEPFFPGRRKFISQAAAVVGAISLGGFFYGMLKGKYDYKLHRETLYFDDLPEAFDGFTITQISDIHSGSFDNNAAVQRGIDMAKAQNSDLFVFTGDLVNDAAWEIEPYISHFSQLKAPYGQFSILGNHDYGDYIQWNSEAEKAQNLENLKQYHKQLGYRLLLDENVALEKDGQKISLIGVQNWGRGFIQIGNLDKGCKACLKMRLKSSSRTTQPIGRKRCVITPQLSISPCRAIPMAHSSAWKPLISAGARYNTATWIGQAW